MIKTSTSVHTGSKTMCGKKIISVLLTVVMLIGCFGTGFTAFADDTIIAQGECGDSAHWKIVDDGTDKTFVVYGSGNMWTRKSWTGDAFDAWDITKIVIEEGVTSIGYGAFGYTTELRDEISPSTSSFGGYEESSYAGRYRIKKFNNATSVIIPNSITSIEDYAFHSCSGLTGSLVIPDSVTSIGEHAFSGCNGFNGTLTLSNSLQTIGFAAFSGCSGFTGSLIIPDSVTSIGNYAFAECSGFNGTLTIGNNVQTIGYCAFDYCSGFVGSLVIPDSVISIDDYAFHYCGFNGSLTLPNNLQTINNYVFSKCNGLTGSLIIPDSVVSIGKEAFHLCCGLDGTLTLGNNIQTIGDGAFSYCYRLTGTLVIPASVVSVGTCAFHFTASFSDGPSHIYNGKLEDSNPYKFFEHYRDANSEPRLVEIVEDSRIEATPTQNGTIVYNMYCTDDYHNGSHTDSNLVAIINEPVEYVPVSISSITATPNPVSINIGETEQLSVEVLPANATNKTVTYSSSNNAVATVSNTGLVTGMSEGTATITVTANDGSGISTTISVTVTDPTVVVSGITASPNPISINVGETEQLSVEVLPADATNKTVTYSSSNNAIATVSNTGLVTGSSRGAATITITANDSSGVSTTVSVTVTDPSLVSSITATPNPIYVDVGASEQLFVDVLPVDANDKTVTYSSSNNAVATVSNTGFVTGVSDGCADITITANDGSGVSTTVFVVVSEPYYGVSSITATPNPIYINAGASEQIRVEVLPANAVNKTVSYFSLNDAVAMVSDTGLVTGVSNGNADIIITATDGSNVSTMVSVIVTDQLPFSARGQCGDTAYWKIEDDGIDKTFTVYGTGDMWTRRNWTGDPFDAWDITKIVIEEGITSIGFAAFGQDFVVDNGACLSTSSFGGDEEVYDYQYNEKIFKNVTNVTIPNSIVSINDFAFQNCSGLTGSLIIPDSVITIGDSAFYNCYNFNGSLILGNNLQTIAENAFGYCSGFTGSLVIPGSVTSIGSDAFSCCYGFNESLTIGNHVQSIGSSAFNWCSGFTGSLAIPNSVTSIGHDAFYSCYGFNGTLTISSNVQSIEYNTFNGCSGFTGSIVIPDSVTSIGDSAFYNCSGFNGTLTLGSNLRTIDNSAFYRCTGLTGSLVIPNSVTSIGRDAFYSCSGFNGTLTIGDHVQTIGNRAFYACRKFTGTLVIPDSVTSIKTDAFHATAAYTNGSQTYNGKLVDSNPYKFFEHYRDAGSEPRLIEVVEASRTEPTPTQNGKIVYKIYCNDSYHNGAHTNSTLVATVNEPIEYVPPTINVSSITATPNPVSVNVGATEQLSVEVLPADAADKTVSYSSSDDTIATVSNTGLVTGVSKGTATVTITANDGSGTTAVVPVTVNKQIVAIPDADATVFVYDGSLKTYTIPASEFYSVSGNTQTNAGHHTVIVNLNNTDACEWSDETIAAKTYDFYIAPATTELTLPTGKTVEYSGAEQQIVNPGSTSNGSIQYKITAINGEPIGNAEWSDEIPAATNAGNYTIAYQVVDTDANHTVPASGTFEAVITKAAIEKPAAGDNSFTYDGTEKTYTPGNGNGYVVTDNTGTDAGNYVAHVTPDDNHVWADENNSDPVDYPFVINRKPVTAPTADTTEFVYDGTEQTCNIPAGEDYTVSNNKATDIGNYTATVTLNDTDNFEWADGTTAPKTIPFEIVKRTATLTPPTGKSLTFNGSAQELVNAGVVKDGDDTINNAIQYRIIKIDDVDVVTAWSNEIPTQTVVGSYVIEYQIVLSDTYNAITGGTLNTSIENGTTEATPPQAITGLVYDGGSKDLVIPGTIQHGSIEYAIVKINGTDVSDPQWSTSVSSAVNAGEYVVGYRYIVDAGYNAVDGGTVTASIAKQPIAKPAAGDNTFTYDGNEKTYTPGDGNGYVVTDNTGTDAGNYVAHVTPDDNHVWADGNNSDPVDYPFTIDKATVEKPAASTTTYQYDGTEKTYDIPESALYNVEGNKRTDAGSQTVTITLTDPDNYTWNDSTSDPVEYTFTVGKASIDFTATGYEGAYDGAPHTISVVVNSPAGATVTYSLMQDGEYTTTCPSVTGYPTQTTTTTVYYKIEKDNNYTPAAGSETIKLNHEHTPGTPVRVENSDINVPSTGTYSFDMAIYCTTCGDEIDRYTVVLHFVDARTPTESEDGYHEHYEDDDGTIYTWDGTKYIETDVTWHYAAIAADSLLMIPTEVLPLNARSDIQTITADDFTYSSLNESVATVDNNGMVTAIAPGRAIVRVSAKDASNEEYVTEAQISVVDADINVSYCIPVGTTSQVDSNVYPSGTEVLGIVYETSDNNIATVNNDGVVNAVAEGEIEVTVNITISDNGMTRTLTLNAPLDTNSHILSHVDEIPATEDHDGVKEHWECTDQDCDKKFWDENGSDLIEDENDLVIHYPGEAEMSNPVCNDDEEKYSFDLTVKCVNDDTVIDGPTTVILTKHDAVDATPEHDGNDKYFTDGSGKIYIWDAANETYKPVDAYVIRHYHDFKWENIDLDPDCIHTGIGDYVEYCPNCGLEFNREEDKDIPATGIHTPGEPHQENYVAPTCTTKGGYDTVVRCTVCEVVLSSVHTELAALGHDWAVTNESYTTDPTCTSSGTKTTEYTCSRCGATKTDETTAKPLGHTDADKDDYCDRCHEQVSWRCSKCDWYDENKDTPGIFGIIVKIVHVIVHMVEKVNHLT